MGDEMRDGGGRQTAGRSDEQLFDPAAQSVFLPHFAQDL
jgi:hypothetical protein